MTFMNHNPYYCRIYWINEDGNEEEKTRVEANGVITHKTMGNHVWIVKRSDNVPIRVCKAAKGSKATACILTNQRTPAWPVANFTFDIVGKTLT